MDQKHLFERMGNLRDGQPLSEGAGHGSGMVGMRGYTMKRCDKCGYVGVFDKKEEKPTCAKCGSSEVKYAKESIEPGRTGEITEKNVDLEYSCWRHMDKVFKEIVGKMKSRGLQVVSGQERPPKWNSRLMGFNIAALDGREKILKIVDDVMKSYNDEWAVDVSTPGNVVKVDMSFEAVGKYHYESKVTEAESTPMKCEECGAKFKKKIGPNTVEVKCPKCGSYDTLPTDYFGEKCSHQPRTEKGQFDKADGTGQIMADSEDEPGFSFMKDPERKDREKAALGESNEHEWISHRAGNSALTVLKYKGKLFGFVEKMPDSRTDHNPFKVMVYKKLDDPMSGVDMKDTIYTKGRDGRVEAQAKLLDYARKSWSSNSNQWNESESDTLDSADGIQPDDDLGTSVEDESDITEDRDRTDLAATTREALKYAREDQKPMHVMKTKKGDYTIVGDAQVDHHRKMGCQLVKTVRPQDPTESGVTEADWNSEMAKAYSAGEADGKSGKPSQKDKHEFQAAYMQGYQAGKSQKTESGLPPSEYWAQKGKTPWGAKSKKGKKKDFSPEQKKHLQAYKDAPMGSAAAKAAREKLLGKPGPHKPSNPPKPFMTRPESTLPARANARIFESMDGNRPVEEAMFAIEPGGLRKLGDHKINILPNRQYYMGASGSPDHIIVTRVDRDTIYYKSFPYKQETRVQMDIGADLIQRGCQTWLNGPYPQYHRELASSLRDLLKGGSGKQIDPRDFERILVRVRPTSEKVKSTRPGTEDPWYAAEEYGNVGGYDAKDAPGGMDYEISMDRGDLKKLKQDKRFKVLSVRAE